MATGLTALAGLFGFLIGLLGLPTGTFSTQLASLFLSLRQFGFQPFYNSTGLSGSFHGSLSHHTITQKKITENERNFI